MQERNGSMSPRVSSAVSQNAKRFGAHADASGEIAKGGAVFKSE
jgi:hypothetical protein